MATVDTLLVRIEADMSDLRKKLNQSKRQVDNSVDKQKKSFMSLGTAIKGVIGIVIAGQVARFGMSMVRMASAVEEMEAKSSVVFGEFVGRVRRELDEFGNQVNRATSQLEGMASSVQDTFVPLGFARGEAADLSVQLTKLAVDVASFNNAMDEDTMRAFQSALVGNHEAVRRFGIVITETELKAELQRMGIRKNINLVTAQEKVQARLNLIIAGTTDAQGDAIRTADSFANTSKGLEASLIELNEAAIKPLLPRLAILVRDITHLINFFKEIVTDTPQEVFENLGKEIETTQKTVKNLSEALQRSIRINGEFSDITDAVRKSLQMETDKLMALKRQHDMLNVAKRMGIEEDIVRITITPKVERENKKLNDSIEKLIQSTKENRAIVSGASEAQILFNKTITQSGGGIDKQKEKLLEIIPAFLESKRATEEFKKSIDEATSFVRSQQTETERLQQTLDNLSIAYGAGKISADEYKEALKKIKEELLFADQNGQILLKGLDSLSGGLADTFVNALETGKFALRDLGNVVKEVMAEMARDFLKAQIRAMILKTVIGAFGGSPAPTLSVGGTQPPAGLTTAGGGSASINVPRMVGERGPELFIPHTSGIVKNNADTKTMMGSGKPIVINQNLNFSTGVSQTVRAEVMNMLPQIQSSTMEAIVDSKQRGGSFATIMS